MLGRGLIKSQPDADCGDFDHREIVGSEFLIACCYAPELFEFVEETLDPVAHAVESAAEGMGRGGGAAVGDDRHGILRLDHRSDPFRVVGLVGEHEAVGRQVIVEQRPGEGTVVGLTGAQGEAERQPLASTTAWIFVVSPPRERPMQRSGPPFLPPQRAGERGRWNCRSSECCRRKPLRWRPSGNPRCPSCASD